jgi:hypothetical protein
MSRYLFSWSLYLLGGALLHLVAAARPFCQTPLAMLLNEEC